MKNPKHDLVPDENSPPDHPGWFEAIKMKVPGIGLFPHCKLGDGFEESVGVYHEAALQGTAGILRRERAIQISS
jgi:hypothetical protein